MHEQVSESQCSQCVAEYQGEGCRDVPGRAGSGLTRDHQEARPTALDEPWT